MNLHPQPLQIFAINNLRNLEWEFFPFRLDSWLLYEFPWSFGSNIFRNSLLRRIERETGTVSPQGFSVLRGGGFESDLDCLFWILCSYITVWKTLICLYNTIICRIRLDILMPQWEGWHGRMNLGLLVNPHSPQPKWELMVWKPFASSGRSCLWQCFLFLLPVYLTRWDSIKLPSSGKVSMAPELQRPPWVYLRFHLQSPNEASDVASQIPWLCFSRHLETLFPEVVKEHPCCLLRSLPLSLSWLPTVNRSTQPWGRRDFSLSPPSFFFLEAAGQPVH